MRKRRERKEWRKRRKKRKRKKLAGVLRISEEVGNIGSYRNEWGVCSNL